MHRGHKYQVKMQKQKIAGHPVGMSPDVLLECPRTSFRDVLGVNVTERVWHSPEGRGEGCILIWSQEQRDDVY